MISEKSACWKEVYRTVKLKSDLVTSFYCVGLFDFISKCVSCLAMVIKLKKCVILRRFRFYLLCYLTCMM